MNYRVFILPRAQKELEELPGDAYNNILSTMLALAQDPRPHGCTKLQGRDGWRVRKGDYRIIYEIDDQQKSVTVVRIGHRRDIYR
jgi:mRNA interferase RelE/StbE